MYDVRDLVLLLLCLSSVVFKNNGVGMNFFRFRFFYSRIVFFLALIFLIDSNIGSKKEFMGIINDK